MDIEVVALVPTPTCVVCNNTGIVELSAADYALLQSDAPIQCSLAHISADIREQIITGTHPECWNKLFADED